MLRVDNHATPAAMLPAQADLPAPVSDPVSHLAAVYRAYPGLRALILRRVRDADVAADILQDAAVTTLEKLRSGEIAHPENVGFVGNDAWLTGSSERIRMRATTLLTDRRVETSYW